MTGLNDFLRDLLLTPWQREAQRLQAEEMERRRRALELLREGDPFCNEHGEYSGDHCPECQAEDELDEQADYAAGSPEPEEFTYMAYGYRGTLADGLEGPCAWPVEEFTQQDHEEYSAWLDEIYAAEELERLERERGEQRDDH